MAARIVLHEDASSGNCYKVRLVAAHLGIAIERRGYDIMRGETRTPDFLRDVNANGRIPVLQVGDRLLPESNAACCYLADGSVLIPADAFDRADALHWLFWEQYHHEPTLATLRYWLTRVGEDRLSDAQRAAIPGKRTGGAAALDLMDGHLRDRDWLVGDRLSLADLVLYPYSHVMEGAGFDRARWPAVSAWIERVEGQPGHIAFDA